MSMIKTCPHCGDGIPAVLFDAHVEACEHTEDGSLMVREPDEQPLHPSNAGSPLPNPDDLVGGGDDMFADLTFQADENEDDPLDVDEGPDPEVDDEFEKLVGQLDINPSIVDVNVRTLDDIELNSRFNAVKQELLNRKEMINPTTETGRDLHSQRGAYLIELRRRGLID